MGHTSCDYIQFIGSEMKMPHAIIRGKNGRRHEVDFGAAPIRVEIYASEETVAVCNNQHPRHLFSEATGEAARRVAKKDR